jgi:hypothetical protein
MPQGAEEGRRRIRKIATTLAVGTGTVHQDKKR